ncbi:MAG: ATP-binding protein [Planctomycetota bacterium]
MTGSAQVYSQSDVCGQEAGEPLRAAGSGSWRDLDFFTNHGEYMPRLHCMQTAEGGVDWPWAIALIIATGGVVAAYLRIAYYWRKSYLAEKPEHRNKPLSELMQIFLWCAFCGYIFSILMFVWPAYRLLFFALIVLNIWSWRFALRTDALRLATAAPRLQAELNEELRIRNERLVRGIATATESLVAAKEDADAASQAKTRFLANMSHEIRTPLTAILGFAELMEDPDAPRDELLSSAGVIHRNGAHLLALLNDVLDISKIEAGELTLEWVDADPVAVCHEVVGLLAAQAADQRVELRVEFEGEIPTRVRTDPTRLKQILINLVGNAIKFTPHGSVTLRVRLEGAPPTATLRFDIVDTGVGIPSEKLASVFEAFSQAEASTTRRFGGTGLGLAISRRLAQRLGGDIGVQSIEGQGSTFTLRVDPGELAHVEYHRDAHGIPSQAEVIEHASFARDARILVAEDGPDNQLLLRHFLNKVDADVTIAEDGQRAVELALDAERGAHPFDLVLMDMQMPRLDGYDATRTLRARGFERPIIALTANAMSTDRERCLDAGCDDHLTKPVDRGLLIETCRRWMESGRRERGAA